MREFDVKALGKLVFEAGAGGQAEVAVIVPLYNYAGMVEETLESVYRQDLDPLALVIIDDASTDDGQRVAVDWVNAHSRRFSKAAVVTHRRNQGLSMARNSGIAWTDAPLLFMLDADNRLRPPALSRLRDAVKVAGTAFAYSQLRMFGDEDSFGIADIWNPENLVVGNYIDAMAMIRRDALLRVNGYSVLADDHGWEDYDLWCKFADQGIEGVFVPEILCEYRVHGTSMLRTQTNRNYEALVAEMALRHPRLFRRKVKDQPAP